MKIITMSIEDWIKVQDNPKQRDVIGRYKSRLKDFSLQLEPLYLVKMGEIVHEKGDVEYVKLDGHTRSYCWEHNFTARQQDFVTVIVYPCKNMEDAKELYDAEDSSAASEKSIDVISSACKVNKITATNSKWTVPYKITVGLRTAYNIVYKGGIKKEKKPTKSELAEEYTFKFKTALQIIYDANLGKTKPTHGVLAALIIAVDRDGKSALDFFKQYADGYRTINEITHRMNPVTALIETITAYTIDKVQGEANSETVCLQALTAYEAHKKGNVDYRTSAKPNKSTLKISNKEKYIK